MSDNSSYAIMSLSPEDRDLRNLPLQSTGMAAVAGQNPVVFQQFAMAHLVLRGSEDSLSLPLARATGLGLPTTPLSALEQDNRCVRWISPDEWLLTVPEDEAYPIEQAIRDHCEGHIAIVNVSGGQTILHMSGEHATEVLLKSTSYDIHPTNFPTGKVVTTTLAQAQVILRRLGDQQFELVIRRSFADYIWAWLQDAAAEYGIACD